MVEHLGLPYLRNFLTVIFKLDRTDELRDGRSGHGLLAYVFSDSSYQ